MPPDRLAERRTRKLHPRLVSIHCAIDARKYDTHRIPIWLDQFGVVAIVTKSNALTLRHAMEIDEESLVSNPADNF